ncbi:MAG: hypothetical protein JWN86_4482 [Planctomycetota bacterium]|nr:hypothetical protein [Planctomycetota bacterium]
MMSHPDIRGRRPGRRVIAPIAEILESRQLLSGEVTLTGMDGQTVIGQLAQGAVARYAIPAGDAQLDHAMIDWGDGTTTDGRVFGYESYIVFPISGDGSPPPPTSGHGGTIFGSHAYATTGTFTIKTSVVARVHGQDDQTIGTTSTLTVDSHSVNGEPARSILGATGFAVADPLAGFSTNFSTDPSAWTASIDWGDGSAATSGTVDREPYFYPLILERSNPVYEVFSYVIGGPGITISPWNSDHLNVNGDHAYAESGHYTATITINDGHGLSATTTASIAVGDSPLVIVPHDNTVVADPSGTIPPPDLALAEFADLTSNDSSPAKFSTYHATIDWGDGSPPTDGHLVESWYYPPIPTSRPRFTVYGSHDYATLGDHSATITVHDESGHSASVVATIHAVGESISLDPQTLDLVRNLTNGGILARGNDAALAGYQNAAMMKATIDWGDGTAPEAGFISPDKYGATRQADPHAFSVLGGHTYALAGTYTVHVTVTGIDGAASASVDSTVNVSRFTGFASFAAINDGVPFSSFGNNGVATVGIPGVDASPADFKATIDWGDGSPTESGTIVAKRVDHEPWSAMYMPAGTVLVVQGDHIYHGVGTHILSVTVTDSSGETHTFHNFASVLPADGTPPASGITPGGTEHIVIPPVPPGSAVGPGSSTVGGSAATTVGSPSPVQTVVIPLHRDKHHGKATHTTHTIQVTRFGHPQKLLTGKARVRALALAHRGHKS